MFKNAVEVKLAWQYPIQPETLAEATYIRVLKCYLVKLNKNCVTALFNRQKLD